MHLFEIPGDQFRPRGHQERTARAVATKIQTGERIFVGNIFPGSGKTAGYLHAVNMLFRAGVIDTCLVLVPRLNLAVQVEQDWSGSSTKQAQASLYVTPVMGAIPHRANEEPLLRGEAFGYVSTYASLCANPGMHERALRGKRFALVLDESQQLRTDDLGGTRGAEVVARIGEAAAFILSVSGTPYGSDNLPLLYARYSDPDERGARTLLADVEATYSEGVELGYLRPFEFTIADGEAIQEFLGQEGASQTLILAEMEQGIRQIIQHEGYWQGMVDLTVQRVREVQRDLDPRLRGLIGASDQRHAKAIERYIRARHPEVRTLTAVSDEQASHSRLRQFQGGEFDILITVAMAHVGYDCPQITVVCMLNDFREWGWVVQFLMRGGRVWSALPRDAQTLFAIIPGDRKAVSICESLRADGQQGLFERQRREEADQRRRTLEQGAFSVITDAHVSGTWAMDQDIDLDYLEFEQMDRARRQAGMGGVPLTKLKRFTDEYRSIAERERVREPQQQRDQEAVHLGTALSAQEQEREARRQLSARFQQLCPRLWSIGIGEAGDWRVAANASIQHFGSGLTGTSLAEIEQRRDWLEHTFLPWIEAQEALRDAG